MILKITTKLMKSKGDLIKKKVSEVHFYSKVTPKEKVRKKFILNGVDEEVENAQNYFNFFFHHVHLTNNASD